jgi:energy-converting hydrogenase Eha subunit C
MRHLLSIGYILTIAALVYLAVALAVGGLEPIIFMPIIAVNVAVALAGYWIGVRLRRKGRSWPRE